MNQVLEKFKWAFRILNAKAYIVATDEHAVVSLPYVNPYKFEDMLALHSQRIAIQDIRQRLQDVLDEHDEQMRYLQQEFKKGKNNGKRSSTNR